MTETERQVPIIIPVGGGKGGIGKSIFSANLAFALGLRNRRVVAVDLDLGSSNLHTFLGIRQPEKGLMDYIDKRVDNLNDVALPSKYGGVRVICGSGNVAGSADLAYQPKVDIIQEISKLPYDYAILDLGAGTGYNVTDFFLLGQQGLVLLAPEITSVLDAYSFIKSCVFRRLQFAWQQESQIAQLIRDCRNPKNKHGIETMDSLIEAVANVSEPESQRIRKLLRSINARIVMNKVSSPSDLKVIQTIQALAQRNLSLAVGHAGHLPFDESLPRSVNSMQPFVSLAPQCQATAQMKKICDTILES